jgi:hypothetical protein
MKFKIICDVKRSIELAVGPVNSGAFEQDLISNQIEGGNKREKETYRYQS